MFVPDVEDRFPAHVDYEILQVIEKLSTFPQPSTQHTVVNRLILRSVKIIGFTIFFKNKEVRLKNYFFSRGLTCVWHPEKTSSRSKGYAVFETCDVFSPPPLMSHLNALKYQ